MPDELRDEALRWLCYAEEDLRAAEILLGREDLPARTACFLSQQAGEKSLKALLIAADTDVPRIHDLVTLRRLLPDLGRGSLSDDELVELSRWAVAARYPGDLPAATKAQAERALAIAQATVRDVRSRLEG